MEINDYIQYMGYLTKYIKDKCLCVLDVIKSCLQ